MGAWGTGAFENDVAEDWGDELQGDDDFSRIAAALDTVIDCDDLSDADRCSIAIAAAETVACSRGRPAPGLPEGIREWINTHELCAGDDLAEKAQAAVVSVKEGSGLADLWKHEPAWKRGLNGLLRRLRSPARGDRSTVSVPKLAPDIPEPVRNVRKHGGEVVLRDDGRIFYVSWGGFGLRSFKAPPAQAGAMAIELVLALPELPCLMLHDWFDVPPDLFRRIAQIRALERLELESCQVDDQVLEALADLPKLRELSIRSGGVTDRGLRHLHELDDLQELDATHTAVTGEGLVALQQRFPDCDIRPIRLLRLAGGGVPRRKSRPYFSEGGR